jgi:hypothetical protein
MVACYHLGWLMIAHNVHPLNEWDWRTQMKLALLQTGLETTLSNGLLPSLRISHWRSLQCHRHEAKAFVQGHSLTSVHPEESRITS